jgi:hypothetical protein
MSITFTNMQVAQYHGVQRQIVVERGNKPEGIFNLVTTISRYTHINSFEFGGNCMRLRFPHLALAGSNFKVIRVFAIFCR